MEGGKRRETGPSEAGPLNRMIIKSLAVIILLAVAWIAFGERLTPLFDRLVSFPAVALSVSPLSYNGGGFVIGGREMTFGLTNNQRAGLALSTDASNRVTLSFGSDAFVLGPRTNRDDSSGRPEIDFAADPADRLSFSARESLLGWPTPFDFRFPFGPSSWWKKYVYYRLAWEKPSGARLEMRWRYERQYYLARGWTEALMMWNSRTGLVSVDIRPESKGLEGAIVRYIAKTKRWNRNAYTIERRGPSQDGRSEIFAVIPLCDTHASAPGAGQSVELYVDRAKEQVSRELGGQ